MNNILLVELLLSDEFESRLDLRAVASRLGFLSRLGVKDLGNILGRKFDDLRDVLVSSIAHFEWLGEVILKEVRWLERVHRFEGKLIFIRGSIDDHNYEVVLVSFLLDEVDDQREEQI